MHRRYKRLAIISSQAFSLINFRGPLIRDLVSREVTVFALAPDYTDASRLAVRQLGAVPVDCSMSRAGMNPLRDIVDCLRLAAVLKPLRLDMIFSYFIKPVIYGTLAGRLASVPNRYALVEGLGYVFTADKQSFFRRLLRSLVMRLYRFGLRYAHLVFLLNPDDKAVFIESRMTSREKIRLLDGIGVDLEHYTAAVPKNQPICFIFVARFLQEKGIYDYVAAVRTLKASHPNVRFLMLGSVDANPSSVRESEVNAWVAEGLLEWPGQVSDVRAWIKQSSVFVLPSYREGLPRSTQEAMAMGRPVITTDVPGCRETVVHGENGFLVPVRDPDALAQAMLFFIDHPEAVARMGAASRRFAEQRFNVHKINEQILTAMEI